MAVRPIIYFWTWTFRVPRVVSDDLVWFDSSRTSTGVHILSLESVAYPVRSIEAGKIFALPADVAPPGSILFEVPLGVDLDPEVPS